MILESDWLKVLSGPLIGHGTDQFVLRGLTGVI